MYLPLPAWVCRYFSGISEALPPDDEARTMFHNPSVVDDDLGLQILSILEEDAPRKSRATSQAAR